MSKPKKNSSTSISEANLRSAIRNRAEEIFRRGGQIEGHDLENWCQAEAEVLREVDIRLTRPAIVINLDGVVYTGEYDLRTCGDYMPGEWKAGDRVPVRLEGDRLILRRPSGKELETYVVKRIG
jgi:hypothetical protein